jgi:pyruvate,water dikinase
MSAWAIGNQGRGTSYWPEKVAERKEILEALKNWRPPRLLGRPPKTITDPFSLMLWGITIEQLQKLSTPWEEQQNTLHGFACSPGVVEGPARVVMRVSDLSVIKRGEILVCPNITPRWSPIFNKIEGVVTDVGGMMSHSAIVCREYNLPAVVGTAEATLRVVTGQQIKVDGNTGTVEILNNN